MPQFPTENRKLRHMGIKKMSVVQEPNLFGLRIDRQGLTGYFPASPAPLLVQPRQAPLTPVRACG
jgi:hypothetical protein